VHRSAFTGNTAAGFEGGPGAAVFSNALFSCDSSTFAGNFGENGIVTAHVARLRGCALRGNGTGYGSAGLYAWNGGTDTTVVEDCVFADNNQIFEGLIQVYGLCRIARNTIAYNSCWNGRLIDVGYPSNGLRVEQNIIAFNTGQGVSGGALYLCNDTWQNSDGGIPDPLWNISADPGFCDPSVRDLRLHDTSPCAPANSACGERIGAFDVGCQTVSVAPGVPAATDLRLLPVAPNPGAPPLRFAFTLPRAAWARLEVRDVAGRTFARIAGGAFEAGVHEARWDGAAAGGRACPGVYFATLTVDGRTTTRTFTLLE